jgi:hypothetical protein
MIERSAAPQQQHQPPAPLHFNQERLLVTFEADWVAPNDLIGRHLYLTGQFDRTIVDVVLSYCRGMSGAGWPTWT